MKKKVLVGMSGGVDSSVSAAILLEQGYDVNGVTLNLISSPMDYNPGTADAKKVADVLGIPHTILDLHGIFKNEIMNYFASEYIRGKTPNPCVVCNKKIKFGALLDYALEHGFDYIATGHYAKIAYNKNINRWLLKKSPSAKDQSYFLYTLTQKQLAYILFPIGELEKSEVRKLAEKFKLPVAQKSESQDICFIKTNHTDFIKSHTGQEFEPGEFIDLAGDTLGTHKGIINYTVGQRKKLGIALGKQMYVNRIDASNNAIILGDENSGRFTSLVLKNTNFIPFDTLTEKISAFVKIRYRAVPILCEIVPLGNNTVRVDFTNPQKFSAPGQSAVFYDREGIVIGGGIIC